MVLASAHHARGRMELGVCVYAYVRGQARVVPRVRIGSVRTGPANRECGIRRQVLEGSAAGCCQLGAILRFAIAKVHFN